MTNPPIKKDTEFSVPYKSICRGSFYAAQKDLYRAFATYSVLHFSADDRETVYTFAFFMKSTVRGGAALIF